MNWLILAQECLIHYLKFFWIAQKGYAIFVIGINRFILIWIFIRQRPIPIDILRKLALNLELCLLCLHGGLEKPGTCECWIPLRMLWPSNLEGGTLPPSDGWSKSRLPPQFLSLSAQTLLFTSNQGGQANVARLLAICLPNQKFHKKSLTFLWCWC